MYGYTETEEEGSVVPELWSAGAMNVCGNVSIRLPDRLTCYRQQRRTQDKVDSRWYKDMQAYL